jgi:hypothetical protein
MSGGSSAADVGVTEIDRFSTYFGCTKIQTETPCLMRIETGTNIQVSVLISV